MIYNIVFSVNFGLETRKSIIHPRSDSSNKSARFSISSEKSYPNGSGMTPGQLGYVTKEVVMNDDIEKKVLINKDGSLSVEMKVRFRLVNDETLQWSTEIKKLPTSTNECSSLQEGYPHCVQGKDVYSKPDFNTECEAEETCSPSDHQMDLSESYCQNCCNHGQGYDIWKNSLHKDDGTRGSSETRSPSNSVGSSEKIIHQKASVDSMYTISRSGEEYTEHVVEKASCFQQSIEEGDTRVEFCSISRCCSQSEVSTSTTKCNMPSDTCKSNTGKICHHDINRKTDYAEFDYLNKDTKVEKYLFSDTDSSSIIQSFKKDDYCDLWPSISRASQKCSEQGNQFIQCVHCYGSQQSHNLHSSPSPVSSCSADAVKSKIYKSMYAAPEVPQEGYADTDSMDSARSSASKLSSRSQCCCCSQCREAATSLVKSDMKSGLKERVKNFMLDDTKVSSESQAEITSPRTVISDSSAQKACKEETKSGNGSTCAISTNTCFSVNSTVCPCCGGCGRLISTTPANMHDIPVQVADKDDEIKLVSKRSSKSPGSKRSNKCTHCAPLRNSAILNLVENIKPVQNNITKVEVKHACSQNALFDLSNCSAASQQFRKSKSACGRSSIEKNISENTGMEGLEERTKSATSIKSVGSAKTNNDIQDDVTKFEPENQIAKENGNLPMAQETITETGNVTQKFDLDSKERVPSAMSTKTHFSEDSDKSHKSNNIQDTATASQPISTSPTADTSYEKIHAETSTVSVKSNAGLENDLESVLNPIDLSAGQKTSQTKCDTKCSEQNALPVASPSPKSPITVKNNNQALSVKSVQSKASSKSTRSNKHSCSSSKCGQRLAKSPSKSPASHGLLDEPLSPTSTASVSLGLGAEERSDDLTERSMNNISQTFDKPSCLSEKNTSEPSVINHTINNSTIIETRERVKTAVSTNSTVSNKSKLSNFMQDPCMNPEVVSGPIIFLKSGKSKINLGRSTAHRACIPKNQCTTKCTDKTSPSNPEIKETRKTDSNSDASVVSLNTSKSAKKPLPGNKYVTKSEMSQICTTPDSKRDSFSPQNPVLLMENSTHAKPDKRRSRSNTSDKNYVLEEMKHVDNNCKNSSSFKQRKISITTQNKTEDHGEERLMPSSLPNASPTDVINDWLKNIPIDSPMYDMGDEHSEQHDETLLHIPDVKEEECFPNEIGEQSDKSMKMKECQEIGGPEVADTVTSDKNTIYDAKLVCNKTFLTIAATSDYNHVSPMLTKRESSTNNCQSSIQVMKVLLSPKLDRCSSLPEVSPTYGRKLSTSAKGLLDCLANLQVIDPDPKMYDKYSKLISNLKSLWMSMPSEAVQDKNKIKVHSAEDEFNPRSSSGVDLSSGSIGSDKGSINGGLEKSVRTHGRAEQKASSRIQRDTIIGAGCGSLSGPPEKINTSAVSSDPITPDIAERVRCSPKLNEEAEGLKATNHAFKTNKHARNIKEIASTFSTRTPENNGNVKSVADKEINPLENNHSRLPPSNQKGQLTKRISQDPDPVWVLSLLKKLEKQFMSHYANAIAEFKVRWDLNDNETLDTMISELKEEVHKRIQSTINRELQKIQSRAGRIPRPPISMLSRDPPVQTEQRRRRLKVMPNKLINPLKIEDTNTASGTDFSDQGSEDEYCPCDTCVKRKMASRVVQCAEALSMAPVLKDFDLRKILQTKKDPPVTMPVQSKLDGQEDQIEDFDSSNVQDKKKNLEVVNEEAKVHIIKTQTDDNDILMEKETKDENIKHENQACENQDKDVGKIHGEWRALREGLSDDEGDGQPAEEKTFDDNIDGTDDDSKTEREIHQVKEGLEDKSTYNHGELTNREDEAAEKATEDTTEVEIEKEPPDEVSVVERKEIQNSEIEAGKEIPVAEKESNDERAEEGVTEGQTNKENDTWDLKKEEIEKRAEIPEEGEETENRTGEETQSAKEGKTSEDESGEAKNSNATSDEQTQDDVPTAAAIPEPRKNKIYKTIEGEKTEEDDTTRKSEVKKSAENSADENQSEPTGTENESHESNSTIYIQKPSEMKDSISVTGQLVSEGDDDDQADVDDDRSEDTDHLSPICDDNSDCKLITQITKTSVESQTGSLEFFKDLTVKEKLRNIQSFMESLNDQDL